MTQPSRVLPNQTVFITRRTERRTFLLRPDPALNLLVLYLVGHFAEQYNMAISAITVLSDHYHMLATDLSGGQDDDETDGTKKKKKRRPGFLGELHRVLALCIKHLRKWDGVVWDPNQKSVLEVVTAQAACELMVYTWLQAVRAGLVQNARDWPGVSTGMEDLDGATIVVQRPENTWLNPQSGIWPEQVELKLQMPPILAKLGMKKARRMLRKELERQLAEAEDLRRKNKWKVLGKKRCEKVSPRTRATSWEPLRSRNPVLAVGRGLKELRLAAIEALKKWRAAYREALERWRAGKRNVVFPYGTWQMAQLHGVRVEPAPSA